MAPAANVRLLDYCAAGQHAVEGWLHEEALVLTLALHRQQRAAGIGGGICGAPGGIPGAGGAPTGGAESTVSA